MPYAMFDTLPNPFVRSPMCSPATCHSCGKTTWAGCGDHAAMVMASVSPEARCSCPEESTPGQHTHSAFGR